MRSILKEISIHSLTGTIEDDGIAVRLRDTVGTRRAPLELLPFVRTAPRLSQLQFFGGGGVKGGVVLGEKHRKGKGRS
jgi:hypothetical protein